MMKKILLVLSILLSSFVVKAEIVQKGNNFVQVSNHSNSIGTETLYTYTDKNGKVYPILMSKKGSFYIVKISKKTGKEYKYYLPKEVQEKIKQQMGII